MSYTIPKEEDDDDDDGGENFLVGLGTDDGDECFCSLKNTV